ncbi:zinc finger SWIM domain-containing protein 7 isoform X3 [Rattus norvegicus]|uniref:zinc finger SWIM domain-containing protein 7 isoform X3 n=1 Tax=Rattus norvegicus TaxID=10116 RepID=UPI00191739B8|nr:zinc finger SWIM domain-containing protein 7 isoform X4 [Rattus norvegicus]
MPTRPHSSTSRGWPGTPRLSACAMTRDDVTPPRPAFGLPRAKSSQPTGREVVRRAMAVTLPEVVEELLSEIAAAVRDSARSAREFWHNVHVSGFLPLLLVPSILLLSVKEE